jgi:hypothetical protein
MGDRTASVMTTIQPKAEHTQSKPDYVILLAYKRGERALKDTWNGSGLPVGGAYLNALGSAGTVGGQHQSDIPTSRGRYHGSAGT